MTIRERLEQQEYMLLRVGREKHVFRLFESFANGPTLTS